MIETLTIDELPMALIHLDHAEDRWAITSHDWTITGPTGTPTLFVGSEEDARRIARVWDALPARFHEQIFWWRAGI